MKTLTPEQRAELEALGAAQADRLEALDADSLHYEPTGRIVPPELAFRHEAHERALLLRKLEEADSRIAELVPRLRERGESWHRISGPLGMTPEGARKKFSHA